MADFLEGFASSFTKGLEQRRLRDQLGLEIQEREDAREAREEQFEETMGMRRKEFEALQQQRAQQGARANADLSLREAGVGLQAEGLNIRREEAEALRTYQSNQQDLEKQRIEIAKRSADATISQAMMKAFDPKIPKSGRKFLMINMAKTLGIDPKSQEYKDMEGAVLGLDDEGLTALKTSIAAMMPDAEPGQITAFAQSIMSGHMTLPDLTKAMGELSSNKTRSEVIGSLADQNLINGTGTDKQAGAEREKTISKHRQAALDFAQRGMHEDARVQLQLAREIEQGEETDPAVRGEIKAKEEAGKLDAEKKQPLPASTKRLLGFQGDMTRGEAGDMGVSMELLDPTETKELLKQKVGTQNAIEQIDQLSAMVEGRPELIGSAGSIVRTVDTILQQISAVPELAAAVTNGDSTAFKGAKQVNKILKRGLAGESAVIRSRVLDLSYAIATARDAGRLSDQDVQRALAGIGDSGSPEQLTAVLNDLKERLREGTARDIETITGMKPIDLMTKDQLLSHAESSDSTVILKSVLRELKRRGG